MLREPHPAGGVRVRSTDILERAKASALSFDSLGLMEVDPLAAKIANRVHSVMTRDLVNVTILDKRDLVVRATVGNRSDRMAGMRFPVHTGLGGLTVSERRTVAVSDYSGLEAPLPYLDMMVEEEGIRAAAGVPLLVDSEAVGLLFIGRRCGPFLPSEIQLLRGISREAAPLFAASMQLERSVELAQAEERRRLASQLHEELIPLLFAIGAAARRTGELLPSEGTEAMTHAESIEAMASAANALARGALTSLVNANDEHDLMMRVKAVSARFSSLTGTPVSVGVTGTPIDLDHPATEVLTGAVVEALNNVAKHAPAASVAITLTYGLDAVTIAVLDDGDGTAEATLPDLGARIDGKHYGLASLARRLAQLDGRLAVRSNEDGGVTVRAQLPTFPQ